MTDSGSLDAVLRQLLAAYGEDVSKLEENEPEALRWVAQRLNATADNLEAAAKRRLAGRPQGDWNTNQVIRWCIDNLIESGEVKSRNEAFNFLADAWRIQAKKSNDDVLMKLASKDVLKARYRAAGEIHRASLGIIIKGSDDQDLIR